LAQSQDPANVDWLKKAKRCSKVAPSELFEAQNILFYVILFEKLKKGFF
jgi:hypothetical protein